MKNGVSILGQGPTQRLDDLTLTADAEYLTLLNWWRHFG